MLMWGDMEFYRVQGHCPKIQWRNTWRRTWKMSWKLALYLYPLGGRGWSRLLVPACGASSDAHNMAQAHTRKLSVSFDLRWEQKDSSFMTSCSCVYLQWFSLLGACVVIFLLGAVRPSHPQPPNAPLTTKVSLIAYCPHNASNKFFFAEMSSRLNT